MAVETSAPECSIARSLQVVGDKWSLLVIRDLARGTSKFSELRAGLGVASDILTARLATLVDAGVVEKRSYREPGARERSSYHLTPAGVDLRVVLGALQQWGDRYRPNESGPATHYEHTETGGTLEVSFVDGAGQPVSVEQVRSVRGPARDSGAESISALPVPGVGAVPR